MELDLYITQIEAFCVCFYLRCMERFKNIINLCTDIFPRGTTLPRGYNFSEGMPFLRGGPLVQGVPLNPRGCHFFRGGTTFAEGIPLNPKGIPIFLRGYH